MGIRAREQAGGAAVDRMGIRLLRMGMLISALSMTPACVESGEFVVTDQALVTEGLELLLEMDEILLAWDVRIKGRVNIPNCHIALESDIDGRFWAGDGDEKGEWSFRGELTPGLHNLVFSIRTDFGQEMSFSYAVEVRGNTAPSCRIAAPLDGQTYSSIEPIAFVAKNSDEEGDEFLSLWTSSLMGGLIEGEEWSMVLDVPGQHELTLEATDVYGLACTDTVTIWVE